MTIDQARLERNILDTAQDNMESFEELYRTLDTLLYSYALSILGESSAAQDVMQDAFLKIRACAGSYRPKGTPLAWVLTITRNLALMELRRSKRTEPTDYGENEALAGSTDMEQAVDGIVLRTALEQLEKTEREIVFLHAVSGLKHREIAAALDLPLGTVLWKYNRALKRLKQNLEEKEVRA